MKVKELPTLATENIQRRRNKAEHLEANKPKDHAKLTYTMEMCLNHDTTLPKQTTSKTIGTKLA